MLVLPVSPGRVLLPAIGYIRVSMLREEQISPAIQRAAIEGCAARLGYRIVAWIEDLDVSGRTFQRKIMGAISAVELGDVKAIFVWKYSRFGRNRAGNQLNLVRVESAGGQLISATEEVDASTAVGKLTRGMLMEIAAFESDRAGEQWAEAFQNRLLRGLPPLGGEYFGYVRRGRQRHPLYADRTIANPADGQERYEPDWQSGVPDLLEELFLSFLSGRGYYPLTESLHKRGILTLIGGRWKDSALRRTMNSGFAAGFIGVHDIECMCGRPSRCFKRTYFPGAHEAVIDHETWSAYLDFTAAKAALPRRSRQAVYPLSGLIKCGYCQGGMHVSRPNARQGYICGWRARREDVPCGTRFAYVDVVEAVVLDIIGEWGPEIEAAAQQAAIAGPRKPKGQREQEVERLQRERERVDRDLDRQTDLVSRGVLPEDAYIRSRDRLIEERDTIDAALAELIDPPSAVNPADYVDVMVGLEREWPTLTVEEKNATLMAFVSKVELFRKDQRTAWVVLHSKWGETRQKMLPTRGDATHCKNGHPYDDDESYEGSVKGRHCRQCKREKAAARSRNKKRVPAEALTIFE
ncbi:recombinase family protein [Streptosporangium sp. NPDC001681]|uniref:recombinase family protein n=1 Tax=Streptosporangium sp. NPDC001681 TaxID=3154395 RepID=UPI00331D554B